MSSRKRVRVSRLRTIGAGVAALAVGAAMTGCAGPSVSSDAGSSSEGTDYSGVQPADSITFWTNHPGGSIDIEKQIIEDFKEETGITVNMVTSGSNYEETSQKFQTAQTSGDVGDVVVLSDATWFTNYLNGSLAPVDPIFEAAGVTTDTYQKTLYDDYLYEDKHYGAPYARSTPLFYYNKDAYQEAGLPDEAPKTWDEVKANSEKLKSSGAADKPFAYPPQAEYPAWTMSNLLWAYGGGWSDEWNFDKIASDQSKQAVQFAQDSVKDGWASVTSGAPETDFASGAIGQVVASTGSLSGVLDTAKFDVGVGFLPSGPQTDAKVVPTGGAGMSIAAKSSPEKQLAAAKFIDFATNAANTATLSAGTGYLPVRTDADMSAVYEKTPQFEVAVKQLAETRSQDYARVFLPGGDLQISRALQSILTTDADVSETLDSVRDELQGLYDKDLKSQIEG